MKAFQFLFFLYANMLFCQTSKQDILANPENNCNRNKDIKFERRIKNFPFSKATKVQVVSFVNYNAIVLEGDVAVRTIRKDSLPRIGTKLDYPNLKEYKDLDVSDITVLTDLLYNYNYDRKKPLTNRASSCYTPRNAIVFLDDAGAIIEYLEICFECEQYTVFKKSNFGEFCLGKLDLLKDFFFSKGILYGTIEREF